MGMGGIDWWRGRVSNPTEVLVELRDRGET